MALIQFARIERKPKGAFPWAKNRSHRRWCASNSAKTKAGRHYEKCTEATIPQVGPFATEAEAIADAERVLFGAVDIKDGGRLPDAHNDMSDAELLATLKKRDATAGRYDLDLGKGGAS